MAGTSESLPTNMAKSSFLPSLQALWRLRLTSGYLFLLASLIGGLGGAWDIEWHATVGRDRTFTPPHDMILLGIGMIGLAALLDVLVETAWAKRSSLIQAYSIPFAGGFQGAMGAYLAGFGAVCSAIAFPLDNYWHALYGIDVSLWAPFHIMIFSGQLLSTIGAAFLLLSTAHLASSRNAPTVARPAFLGATIALGDLLLRVVSIINPALGSRGFILLPFGAINVYPVLLAALSLAVWSAARRALPWHFAATSVCLVFLADFFLNRLFVPPAMVYLIHAEHQTLLPTAALNAQALAQSLRLTPLLIVIALVSDVVVWYGQRRGWPRSIISWAGIATALPPLAMLAAADLLREHSAAIAFSLPILGLAGFAISLLLIVPGIAIGGWFGFQLGDSLKEVEQ